MKLLSCKLQGSMGGGESRRAQDWVMRMENQTLGGFDVSQAVRSGFEVVLPGFQVPGKPRGPRVTEVEGGVSGLNGLARSQATRAELLALSHPSCMFSQALCP